jgi:50S ribosomal subunit-associated GTPase HflX
MRAVLVGVDFGKGDFLASLEELSLLSKSAGAQPVASVTGRRASPDSALFVGSGKAEEIRDTVFIGVDCFVVFCVLLAIIPTVIIGILKCRAAHTFISSLP